MQQETELERTFLARVLPSAVQTVQPIHITDTYFPDYLAANPKLRLRDSEGSYMITKKESVDGTDYSKQTESTIQLTKEEYESLRVGSDRVIEKLRYITPLGGLNADIDVFQGDLKGLVLIEFEFATESEKASFKPPHECLVDVTQERFIAGGYLAGRNYDYIRNRLKKFGYEPLG